MFRASLASFVVAASIAATGCSHFCMDVEPLRFDCFTRDRGKCCPAPAGQCCDSGCCTADSGQFMGGPVLAPPDQPLMESGTLPLTSQPRLAPTPQSIPTPYRP